MNITLSETIQFAILIVLLYLCVYSIVDRICTHKEKCAEYEAVVKYNLNKKDNKDGGECNWMRKILIKITNVLKSF